MPLATALALALQVQVDYGEVKFVLPEGYQLLKRDGEVSRVYRKAVMEPVAGNLDVGLHTVAALLKRDERPALPIDIARILGLPPDARITLTREAWREHQVPAADYRFQMAQGPGFGMCLFLPLENRTFLLEIAAPETLEEVARADLQKIASSATGKSPWSKKPAPKALIYLVMSVGLATLLVGMLWSTNDVYKGGNRGVGCWMMLAWLMVLLPAIGFFVRGISPVGYWMLVSPVLCMVYGMIHFDELKKPTLITILGYLLVFVALAIVKYTY